MSELAFNINGEAFEVPANATGWRVRKMRAKGAPEVVYAREGQPLVLPISAEIDDLRAEVDTTGRYRLDLVDQNNKAIEGAPSGYVQVNIETDAAASSERTGTSATSLGKPSDHVVIEAMRLNSEIAKSVVDRFPQMLEAAAQLLRAADGAGLPTREPRAIDDDEDDEDNDDDEPAPTASPVYALINSLVEVMPVIVAAFANKGTPAPAAVEAPALLPAPAAIATAATTTATEAPPITPATLAKIMAVQAALTPAEAARARALGAELSPAERHAFFEQLSAMSVPEAATKVRSLIGSTQTGGAS